jgi:hypothetical protein
MNDEILRPDFSMDGYSLADARKKNEAGLCAMENCEKALNDTCIWMCFKICKDCHKPLWDGINEDCLKEERKAYERFSRILEASGIGEEMRDNAVEEVMKELGGDYGIEFWRKGTKDDFKSAAEKLLDKGFTIEEASDLLAGLYSSCGPEYGC